MLKKNVYERRFNTAGARIIMSSKLPSDFFKPIIQREEKECSLWEHVSSRNEEGCRSPKIIVMNPKEEMQFTFHRSNSEGKAVPKEKIFREKLPYLRSSQFSTRNLGKARYKENSWQPRQNIHKLQQLHKISSRFLIDSSCIKLKIGEAR